MLSAHARALNLRKNHFFRLRQNVSKQQSRGWKSMLPFLRNGILLRLPVKRYSLGVTRSLADG